MSRIKARKKKINISKHRQNNILFKEKPFSRFIGELSMFTRTLHRSIEVKINLVQITAGQ